MPRTKDRLSLRRFNGVEVYPISSASMSIGRSIDERDPVPNARPFTVQLDVETDEKALESCEDTAHEHRAPSLSANLAIPPGELANLWQQPFQLLDGGAQGEVLASI